MSEFGDFADDKSVYWFYGPQHPFDNAYLAKFTLHGNNSNIDIRLTGN